MMLSHPAAAGQEPTEVGIAYRGQTRQECIDQRNGGKNEEEPAFEARGFADPGLENRETRGTRAINGVGLLWAGIGQSRHLLSSSGAVHFGAR